MKFPKKGIDLGLTLKDFEKSLIIQAMRAANGVCAHAAKLLNISKQSLYFKLKSHELKADKFSGLN